LGRLGLEEGSGGLAELFLLLVEREVHGGPLGCGGWAPGMVTRVGRHARPPVRTRAYTSAMDDEHPLPPDAAPTRLGIRELRGRLTSLVRRAGGGERIIVTIGGRPVA